MKTSEIKTVRSITHSVPGNLKKKNFLGWLLLEPYVTVTYMWVMSQVGVISVIYCLLR